VPEPEAPRAADSATAPVRTVPRPAMLEALAAQGTLCSEYRTLLEQAWEADAPDEDTRRLLARHQALARAPDGPFALLHPAGALLAYVLERLRPGPVAFRLRGRAAPLPEAGEHDLGPLAACLLAGQPSLEALAAEVYAAGAGAAQTGGTRAQRLLEPVAALLKALLRQDWADVELVLNHLNMVTTSRESHALGEQIGHIVRGIHASLEEISRDVPLDALSSVSEEIPDAVDKLQSVITELEAGANRSLDVLERLSGQVSESRAYRREACEALAACDAELDALSEAEPAAAEELAAIRTLLAEGAAAPLEAGASQLQAGHDAYMALFASQSYQDLTGQTLKKVIAFIEGLQYQLIQVISKDRGSAPITTPPATEGPPEAGPDARNRLSQDRVDSMLAELGF